MIACHYTGNLNINSVQINIVTVINVPRHFTIMVRYTTVYIVVSSKGRSFLANEWVIRNRSPASFETSFHSFSESFWTRCWLLYHDQHIFHFYYETVGFLYWSWYIHLLQTLSPYYTKLDMPSIHYKTYYRLSTWPMGKLLFSSPRITDNVSSSYLHFTSAW